MQTRFKHPQDECYRYARTSDLDAMTAMLADDRVGQWLWFVPAPRAALRSFFRPLLDGQWESLALGDLPRAAVFVVETPTQEYLGMGASLAVEGSPGGFEIGFQLSADAWGRGVGTRLAWFLAAWTVHAGSGVHAAYRIEAACLEGNLGSQRILTKLGLAREARRPGYRLKHDQRHTELLYGAQVGELDADRLRAVAEQTGMLTASP